MSLHGFEVKKFHKESKSKIKGSSLGFFKAYINTGKYIIEQNDEEKKL